MNRKNLLAVVLVLALETALIAPLALGGHGGPADPVYVGSRYVPRPAGVERPMTFVFGPYTIPPGHDINRVTIDLPPVDGYITSIAPNLIDVETNAEPNHLEMHIHHAHWFRLSTDPGDEYYTLNLAWVFGTGEERTQGSLNDRSAAEPGGPRYGIFIPGGQPQVMIFMLHNKISVPKQIYVTLDVYFAFGNEAAIRGAADCGLLLPDETCSAGQDFNALKGRLWGSTFDVPREAGSDGIYVHPRDIDPEDPELALGRHFTAPYNGTLVALAGHMHPNGREVVIANLGAEGSGCEADLDGDGFAGVTLLRSHKWDRNPMAWPHTEEYQMGASAFGFRAPIHAGDRITQFGVYDNQHYASYGAMSYVGVYIDRERPPVPRGDEGCTLGNTRPVLIDNPDGDATQSILNQPWHPAPLPLCGPGLGPACHRPIQPKPEGIEARVVEIAAFAYVPGDQNLGGLLGAPPRVKQGESLRFVNADTAGAIRHTVTSCEFPCNGPYVANYPQPDGVFDSGKLGNLDYIDGGLITEEAVPFWDTPADLEPGLYSYFCRLHPTMRGAFEVVA